MNCVGRDFRDHRIIEWSRLEETNSNAWLWTGSLMNWCVLLPPIKSQIVFQNFGHLVWPAAGGGIINMIIIIVDIILIIYPQDSLLIFACTEDSLALLLEIWALIPVPVKCQLSTDIFLTLTRYSSGQSGMRWYILSAILLGIKCYFLKSYVKTSWRCVIYFCHCHKALSPSSLLMGQRLQFWIIFICPCWNLAFQNNTERALVLN